MLKKNRMIKLLIPAFSFFFQQDTTDVKLYECVCASGPRGKIGSLFIRPRGELNSCHFPPPPNINYILISNYLFLSTFYHRSYWKYEPDSTMIWTGKNASLQLPWFQILTYTYSLKVHVVVVVALLDPRNFASKSIFRDEKFKSLFCHFLGVELRSM